MDHTEHHDGNVSKVIAHFRPDALSHMLAWVRLTGETVHRTEMGSSGHVRYAPGSSHIYLVTEGSVTLRLSDGQTHHLEAGDLALLPHGPGHEIISKDVTGRNLADIFHQEIKDRSQPLGPISDEGVKATFIAGVFRFARPPLPPVLMSLPSVVHLPPHTDVIDWRGPMATFLMHEVDSPALGSALMISRIIDLMVIRTLRGWIEQRTTDAKWLAEACEERLSRALAAMHDDPARSWSLGDLAAIAGMSRSVFADRFARATGEPPLRYLMRWRLSLAIDLLEERTLSISEIARTIGYRSEPGFSRAFKAFHGVAPSAYWVNDPAPPI